jgi:hypothetical protein
MNRNLNNEEFVNRYLDNELSEIDKLDFENKLLNDADLREEYNFQKDLVNGIKEVRRMELKSRLSNIPIEIPVYQTIGFKTIAAVTVSAGIGLGAYFFLDNKNDTPITKIDLNQNNSELVEEYTIPEIPKAITPIIEEKTSDDTPQVAVKKNKQQVVVAKHAEEAKPKVIQPNVIQPDVLKPSDEEDFESNEIGNDNQVNNLESIKENVESNVAVSTVKDKKNKFHYKFFENKLYLLGNFSEMPYEIIELNSSKGKTYFLYYNESYYQLNKEQAKPTPLVKIENDSLVNELKIIQMNQNN